MMHCLNSLLPLGNVVYWNGQRVDPERQLCTPVATMKQLLTLEEYSVEELEYAATHFILKFIAISILPNVRHNGVPCSRFELKDISLSGSRRVSHQGNSVIFDDPSQNLLIWSH